MISMVVPTIPPARLRRRLLSAGAAVALVVVAGCGGDDAAETAAEQTDQDQSREGGSATQTWPLTGEPVEDALPDYPVLAVKVDNTSNSEPQLGLEAADVITEELVEGGSTRLAAFFYSQLPEVTGPVRSMRATDIGIVKPAEAVLIASGAASPTRARVDGAAIETFTEAGGAAGFVRAADRTAPYNLMMELPALAETLEGADPLSPYLPFGTADMSGGKPATSFDVEFSAAHTTAWQYDDGDATYMRDGYAEEGADLLPDSVLVLRVKIGDAGYLDPAGNPVPETIYEGAGAAMLFHQGNVVAGTWSKDELKSPLQLTTKSGDPMQVPPGRTWIELVPTDTGAVRIDG